VAAQSGPDLDRLSVADSVGGGDVRNVASSSHLSYSLISTLTRDRASLPDFDLLPSICSCMAMLALFLPTSVL